MDSVYAVIRWRWRNTGRHAHAVRLEESVSCLENAALPAHLRGSLAAFRRLSVSERVAKCQRFIAAAR